MRATSSSRSSTCTAPTACPSAAALARQGLVRVVLFGTGYRPDPTRQAALPQGLLPPAATPDPGRAIGVAEPDATQGRQALRAQTTLRGCALMAGWNLEPAYVGDRKSVV